MKIAQKSIGWTDPQAGEGVANFLIYYAAGEGVQFNYDLPNVPVPASPGQTEYTFMLPGGLSILEGPGTIWVAPSDAEGNIADPASLTRIFDFTPPQPVMNLRII